jgi:hypothetical protein
MNSALQGGAAGPWSRFWVWILLTLVVGAIAAGAQSLEPAAELELLAAARERQVRDLAAWREYRFLRDVERRRLGRGGEWELVERLQLRVEPRGEGFTETLLRIDGRAPTSAEVAKHRQAGRFAKHYESVIAGRGEEIDEGYALADLLSLPSYRPSGREEVGGVPCLRFDFEPAPESPGGLAGRVARASAGTLWLTEDGHLVQALARTVDTVRFASGLVRIPHLEVRYQARQVDAGVWLPVEIALESEISVFGNGTRRRNRYRYSSFERVGGG